MVLVLTQRAVGAGGNSRHAELASWTLSSLWDSIASLRINLVDQGTRQTEVHHCVYIGLSVALKIDTPPLLQMSREVAHGNNSFLCQNASYQLSVISVNPTFANYYV